MSRACHLKGTELNKKFTAVILRVCFYADNNKKLIHTLQGKLVHPPGCPLHGSVMGNIKYSKILFGKSRNLWKLLCVRFHHLS